PTRPPRVWPIQVRGAAPRGQACCHARRTRHDGMMKGTKMGAVWAELLASADTITRAREVEVSVPPPSGEAQQHQEQVDEVQVEGEGADDGVGPDLPVGQ